MVTSAFLSTHTLHRWCLTLQEILAGNLKVIAWSSLKLKKLHDSNIWMITYLVHSISLANWGDYKIITCYVLSNHLKIRMNWTDRCKDLYNLHKTNSACKLNERGNLQRGNMRDGQKAFEADIRSVPHSDISEYHNRQCSHVQYENTVWKHAKYYTVHCNLTLLAVGLYTTLAVMLLPLI